MFLTASRISDDTGAESEILMRNNVQNIPESL